MSNATIGIKIDPTGAVQGARTVKSSFKDIGTQAKATENAVDQMSRNGVADLNSFAGASRAARKSSFHMGHSVQQAGYQVGDFAVQVASGQGVLRPFIQQGTQLVSMFGPWGAVLGAAGAIVGALATTLWASDEAAESAEVSYRTLEDATVDLGKAMSTTEALTEVATAALLSNARAVNIQSRAALTSLKSSVAIQQAELDKMLEMRRQLQEGEAVLAIGAENFSSELTRGIGEAEKAIASLKERMSEIGGSLDVSELDIVRLTTQETKESTEAIKSEKEARKDLLTERERAFAKSQSFKQAIEDETSMLKFELEAVQMSGVERELFLTQKQLEIQARRQNITVTNEEIAALVQSRSATLELQEASKRAADQQEELSAAGKSFASSFISDMRNGANAAEALGGVLDKLADKLIDLALTAAFDGESGSSLISGISAALGSASANGNVFSGGNVVQAFANGGIVNGPTTFPMNDNQFGLMGEAGPEAIMPLTRGPSGRLGVDVSGGQQKPVVVAPVVNIQNNSTAEVSTESGTTSGGQPYTNVIVDVMKNATNKGQMDGVNAARTGARPKAIGR